VTSSARGRPLAPCRERVSVQRQGALEDGELLAVFGQDQRGVAMCP
jgi:hypothetical protein